MFHFEPPTLLVLAGLSFVTASCALGRITLATGGNANIRPCCPQRHHSAGVECPHTDPRAVPRV